MKELGSFIEMDFHDAPEYYEGENVLALNTARASIYHALMVMNLNVIHLPFYLCPSVEKFLLRKGIRINKYQINNAFEPININPKSDEAILIVNYFGILSPVLLQSITQKFKNVIVDNSQSFFSEPFENCYTVYSPRKFVGVPDGAYVIGENIQLNSELLPQDFSSNHAAFLLKRVEYGSSAVYAERMKNEERLDNSDLMRMSKLTQLLLKNIDYKNVREKRQENFRIAHGLLKDINLLSPQIEDIENINPMVYPLLVENAGLVEKLNARGIYTGRWWKDVLKTVDKESFEARLSTFMVPVPIDQRYGKKELAYIKDQINEILNIN
jgi:hypothetical protein